MALSSSGFERVMFTIGYLVVVAVLLIPLVQAATAGRGSLALSARHLAATAVLIIAIVGFEAALRISLEYYWFGELGKSVRFWLALNYCTAIFFAVFLLTAWFVGANLSTLCRAFWP